MNNIVCNYFNAIKKVTLFSVLFFSITYAQGVFITEIADPENAVTGGRFVELYNNTDADVDLGGWSLRRWTNENTDPQPDKAIQGIIPAGGFFIITNNAEEFEGTYGIAANQDIGEGGPADGNGDDDLALINADGEVADLYGEGGGTDNSGTPWDFEDGRAERIATVTAGNPFGNPAEWNIDNGSGGGDGAQEAPGDYDPGAWVGHEHVDGPDIDPCADGTLNCDNLHLIGIVGPETIKEIINENIINEATNLPYNINDLAALALNPGEQQFILSIDAPSWSDEPGTIEANYFPELGSVEDSLFVFTYEVPGGYPENIITYRWRLDLFNSQGLIYTKGENAIFNSLGEEDTDCLIQSDEDGLTRYWDPEDWAYELNEISSGNMDPADIFNFDFFGGCELFDDNQPEWSTFLGEFEGREYYIAGIDLSWDNARDTASWYEGHLATITSEAENQFIQQALMEESASGQFWIGAYEDYYDSASGDRSFAWVTGESFDYENWYPGEPNAPGYETAVELNVGEDGKWNDFAANNLLGSILEFPSDHELSDDPCEDGTTDCNNLQFVGAIPPALVDRLSDDLNMTIEDIHAAILDDDLEMYLKMQADGLGTPGDSRLGKFRPEISSTEDSFFVFIAGYPEGFPSETVYYQWVIKYWDSESENVLLYQLSERGDYFIQFSPEEDWLCLHESLYRYWDPSDYDYELSLIEDEAEDFDVKEIWPFDFFGTCETPFDDEDQPDWATFLGEFEGREYYIAGIDLSWDDARDTAFWYEGHLATITSEAENQFILDAILTENGGGDYWIGGYESYYDSGTGDRSFSWLTDEPFDYANWGPEEPNNPGEETAIEFMAGNAGYWNDLAPANLLGSILEYPSDDEPEPQGIVFIKPDNADPTLPENQDRISENVWITRGNSGGALYNAAIETGYSSYVSPQGTRWAYGPTLSQSSYDNYTSLEDVVYSFSSGFAYVVGEIFSLHVLETNMFYDVSFTSWAQGNGGGNGAGGGFSYIRTTVDGGIEPPGPLNFSNYTLSISDAESYQSGSESVLPSLNVDGDGIVIKAEFAVSDDITDPYVGALGIFWDSNFNGQLDDGDYNVSGDFYDSNEDDDMGEDGPRNREHDEGPGVVALVDNGPMDTDDAVGIFVGFIDDIDFMAVQGATFLFAEINDNGDPTNSFTVNPYSNAGIRFSGQATINGSGEPADGIFVRVEKLIYVEDDNWGPYFDYVDVAQGVTQISGEYNIGSSQLNIGDSVEVLVESSLNERLYPLIGSVDDGFGMEIGFNIDADQEVGSTYPAAISVMKLNTIVQGFVLDENGMPLEGEVMIVSHLGADGEMMIDSYAEVDDNGFYSGWSMNGSEADIVFFPYDGSGQPIDNTVMIQSDTFDEELDAYVFNYNIEMSSSQMGTIYGWLAFYDFSVYNPQPLYLDGEVTVYNNSGFSTTVSTGVDGSEPGHYKADVPLGYTYYLTAVSNNDEYVNDAIRDIGVDYPEGDYQVNFEFMLVPTQHYTISGYVYDQNAEPVYDAEVNVASSNMNNDHGGMNHDGWYDWAYTDASGYYSISVPAGVYDIDVAADGFLYEYAFGVEVNDDVVQDFNLNPVGAFTGGVQGVVTLVGEYVLDEPVYIDVESNLFSASTYADENGFFSIELIDGVYDIYANTMGYESYYMENAFEVSGNTVIYDIELFEYGFAGPPHMMNLHDVANDQGRQMRAVWDAGMPGDWGYFTQFSIWRKVNNAPIELWDYIETVPWHGMDPYAAVVPTLGDSSMHGMHMSTFMVTAHTEDVAFWLDSEPMSGYSIDNLHPEAPMSVSFSTNPGAVSLTWSGSVDEDFSYFNIYRQDILTNEPAMVFTTTDSFYVDQDLSDVGAYEYWVTAVDISGLESEASGIVSAVLSSEDELGMPTEFALKQNYPNPFNPSTQIQYSLPSESRVVISIYDLTGRKIRTLVNEVQSAGHRSVMWNATNEIGRQVSAGMYIYSIQAGDFIQNRKMVLMK